ncbi:SOS response-associated peptidase family protein [Bradyrhizobium sp. Leaf401]|uniref:SOS response-associated peptidase family protein n=1 Tax=Bradyrhizobium sp. Leaf401 TaxID=2876564 RepID=UPI001E30005F|nr:SOS response-associated peptidase family protein [Bradyrhizobium sp. Leaf401]
MRIPSSRWAKKLRLDQTKKHVSCANQRLDREVDGGEASPTLLVYRLHPETKQLTKTSMNWGLIPHYLEERPDFQPLYAPTDILFRRRMFLEAYRKRRCIVPMKEFHQRDRLHKRRTIAHKEGRLLNFAGIWENWRAPGTGDWERTFAIVTVRSNGLIANTQHRMPLIIDEANFNYWLDSENDPRDLLTPSSEMCSMLIVLA